MPLLDDINSVSDLKKLKIKQLPQLAAEIRRYLVETVSITGGHLASNLGVVELSIALHYVFDAPEDKIIWDVGHQSYVHKILTGRKEQIKTIRQQGGISGFPNIEESPFDAFTTGHSSTSVSVGLGFARARDLKGQNHNVISVIGDGAMTGGMAFEALNDLGSLSSKMIVILNDNNMSISKNVGGMSRYLSKIRLSRKYSDLKLKTEKIVRGMPLLGDKIFEVLAKIRDRLKFALVSGKMFEQLGLKYFGPVDGHNIEQLIEFLLHIKHMNGPVLLHISTVKGKGMPMAEQNPSRFHGINPISQNGNGNGNGSFSSALGKTLIDMAKDNPDVVAITAAMQDGTGLSNFAKEFPDRFFDVAICEPHAVTLAAAMAKSGLKPYFAVYSTFLQRAYDQILHDVCLSKLPVTLCVDRAGVVGADGITHQGIYDLSYLSTMPDMTIFAPKNTAELRKVLEWSVGFNGPLAIRYPKDSVLKDEDVSPIELGKWEILSQSEKSDKPRLVILACGGMMISLAREVCKIIGDKAAVTLVNARFIKPLDQKLLDDIYKTSPQIAVMEDNIASGGLMSGITLYAAQKGYSAKYEHICLPQTVPQLGSIEQVYEQLGLTPESIAKNILRKFFQNFTL